MVHGEWHYVVHGSGLMVNDPIMVHDSRLRIEGLDMEYKKDYKKPYKKKTATVKVEYKPKRGKLSRRMRRTTG